MCQLLKLIIIFVEKGASLFITVSVPVELTVEVTESAECGY